MPNKRCMRNVENSCMNYPYCFGCGDLKDPTNYDKILKVLSGALSEMTIDKMAELMVSAGYVKPLLLDAVKQWLESEVKK